MPKFTWGKTKGEEKYTLLSYLSRKIFVRGGIFFSPSPMLTPPRFFHVNTFSSTIFSSLCTNAEVLTDDGTSRQVLTAVGSI